MYDAAEACARRPVYAYIYILTRASEALSMEIKHNKGMLCACSTLSVQYGDIYINSYLII